MVSPRLSMHFCPEVVTLTMPSLFTQPGCLSSLLCVLPPPQRLVESIKGARLPPMGLPQPGPFTVVMCYKTPRILDTGAT